MGDPVLAWAVFGAAWVVLLAVNVRRTQRKQSTRGRDPL
jgi:hypothetical protein